MEVLSLYFRGEAVSERVCGPRPVAIGRSASCDLVVPDPDVAPHHSLVLARGGTVVVYDLTSNRRKAINLPYDREIAIGKHHALRRRNLASYIHAGGVQESRTDSLQCVVDVRPAHLCLRVGRGAEARRVKLDERPLRVGTALGNDLILMDCAVSAEHCRIESAHGAHFLRDLDSRNGTYVQGVRVSFCDLAAGSRLRVGRTEMFVERALSQSDSERGQSMIAASDAMRDVLGEVERWSALPWPVLISGESGVGKEGVANALHERGTRAAQPFVALNAGGLARELVESELFGHVRGAFTGAAADHRGVFEQAHRGTLFLDEIGELPLDLQARLLRVLETGELRRVGAESSVTVDVRLVCATHRDLRAMVADGTFRSDLYYRIARLVVHVPPLRERPADIPALSRHFLQGMEHDVGRRVLTEAAQARLLAYSWPGNARELRNVLSVAAVATSSDQVDSVDVELALRRVGSADAQQVLSIETLRNAVEAQQGNYTAAARALGMARTTLRDRMRNPEKATTNPRAGVARAAR